MNALELLSHSLRLINSDLDPQVNNTEKQDGLTDGQTDRRANRRRISYRVF